MTVSALSLGSSASSATTEILRWSYDFQMCRIEALNDVAQVVHLITLGDRTNVLRVNDSLDTDQPLTTTTGRTLIHVHVRIPVLIRCTLPYPTG